MNSVPQISIIVPVYNAERWLRRCIDSILDQTHTDFELLLIDDGSTDASFTICEEYASFDCRIRVFHKFNGGASSARNLGLDNAQGLWITFCDADDYVYPEWLANFNLQEGQNYDLLTQGMKTDKPFFGIEKLQKESGFDFSGTPINFLDEACEHYLLGYNVIKAFRKKIIKDYDLKFNEKLWLREDEAFFLEYISHCKKIKSSKEAGYFYFTPEDWEKKYKLSFDDRIFLEEYIFDVLGRINPSVYNKKFAVSNRNSLNKYLTEAFYETKNLQYVRKLQMYFRKYPDFAPLFRFTRKLIQIDPTCKISSFVLFIHMSIRKIIKTMGVKAIN